MAAGRGHMMSKSPRKPRRRFWRISRLAFRWVRIAIWLLLLSALVAAIWLNRVGLPGFAKEQLLLALRERGMDAEFTRLRVAWYRGIVAENLRFGRSNEQRGPRGSATEAELHLRLRPLLRGQFDVKGVALRGGQLAMPIWGTNDTPRELEVQQITGDLRFLPGDQWELAGLSAEAFGVRMRLNGTVTNASFVRKWTLGRERPRAKTPQAFWHDLVWNFERTQFAEPTEIIGNISGDARNLGSFRATLNITSPAIDSPWGRASDLRLATQIDPQPGALIHAVVELTAQQADTRWGKAESVQLQAQVTPSLTQWTPTNAHLALQVKRAQTPWVNAAVLNVKADFRPNPADAASSLVDYAARGQQIQTRWARFAQADITAAGVVSSSNAWPSAARARLRFAGGEAASVRAAAGDVTATLTLPTLEALALTNRSVTWATRLEKVAGDFSAQLASVRWRQLESTSLTVRTSWRAPQWRLHEFTVPIFGGVMGGNLDFDTLAGSITADLNSTIDWRQAAHFLDTNAQHWLSQLEWEQPPAIQVRAQAMLPPAWTNGWTNVPWNTLRTNAVLAGRFEVERCSFRGIPVSGINTDFTSSNSQWRLPNLRVIRPEGEARASVAVDEPSRDIAVQFESTINPLITRPLLPVHVQRVFDDFNLPTPPHARGSLHCIWTNARATSLRANVAGTNVAYRGQPVVSCRSLVTLTNQFLQFVGPDVIRAEGSARADSVVIDWPRRQLYINNATGRLHPADVTKVIHPNVAKTMAPYQFKNPPQAHVWGRLDLHDEMRSDLWFDLAGGPFQWEMFRFQTITGLVHWGGRFVTLSNVAGRFHGGGLEGSLKLDFNVPRGVDFSLRTLVHNVDLHSLMSDVSSPSNRLEGALGGLLVITNANSENPASWFGYGNLSLQDGLIWDVPVFGLFSPVLNAIKPGAGNNRARDATATFIITNSVIFSSDMRIHASGMRLNYDGTVDFDTRVNGRMEAELFRDTPGVGTVVSKVLWPVTKVFEYKVSGTFGKPKAEPLFIPKIFLMPFHPLRTLRELMGNEGDEPLLR